MMAHYEDQLTDEADYYNQKEIETNKLIEAQAAEIAKLTQTAMTLGSQSREKEEEIIQRDSRIFELQNEVAKLRALLERWQEFSGVCYTTMIFDQPYRLKSKEGKLDGLVKDTTEALK